MKSLLCAAALSTLMLQPALAASCWSSADGGHLLFAPEQQVATYWHRDGLVEACNLMPFSRSEARVWCDVSSMTGVSHLVAAHRRLSAADRLWWDDRYFVRASCPD